MTVQMNWAVGMLPLASGGSGSSEVFAPEKTRIGAKMLSIEVVDSGKAIQIFADNGGLSILRAALAQRAIFIYAIPPMAAKS